MTWVLLLVVMLAMSAALWLVWMLVPSQAESAAPSPSTNTMIKPRSTLRNRGPKDDVPLPLDPFEALQLQLRLSAVANNVRELEGDETAYARAARLLASQLAYDALLAEACGLAGISVQRGRRRGPDPDERFREEVELASRGWTW